ncbi:MAG TPA: hypothetical protein VMP01_24475 [Pirellulaceae bacterium]|nr:hypothetical protein [Pirellulaceae bacterium]
MPHWLPEVAEYIAEYFSRDARYGDWPVGPSGTSRISFTFEDPTAWYAVPLLEAWRELLRDGYAATDGIALFLSAPTEPADMTVRFREERHRETGDLGLSYELPGDRGCGWFSIEE